MAAVTSEAVRRFAKELADLLNERLDAQCLMVEYEGDNQVHVIRAGQPALVITVQAEDEILV